MELIWIYLSLSKWRLLCSLSDHTIRSNMLIIKLRMVIILQAWEQARSNVLKNCSNILKPTFCFFDQTPRRSSIVTGRSHPLVFHNHVRYKFATLYYMPYIIFNLWYIFYKYITIDSIFLYFLYFYVIFIFVIVFISILHHYS